MVGRLALLLVVACSSKRPPRVEDAAKPVAPASDAAAPDAAVATSGSGDVAIRVEWKNVPAAMRASPGRTPCNTPRAPLVAPTTTWGIPDAIVVVDGAPPVTAAARITLADCALSPRVAVGDSLVVESALDRPAGLVLARRGDAGKLPALVAGDARAIQLPVAGHAVAVPLEAGAVYQLATGDKDPELTWIVAGTAAISDASGVASIKNLPSGAHGVTAWLPPRAGQPARQARGTVTVVANGLAELTLELVP